MSNSSQPMDRGSPKGSPPSMALRSSALTIARSQLDKARSTSAQLREKYEVLSREVEPDVKPDEEQPEPTHQASLELASIGIQLATKEKESIQLERTVVVMEQDAGILLPKVAEKRHRELNRRYFSAGDDLWRNQKKKIRLDDDPGTIQLLDPRSNHASECLLALYKKSDDLEKPPKRPKQWRQESLSYYIGSGADHTGRRETVIWCHISGMWHMSDYVKAAHIVPFFLDNDSISEMLFSKRAQSLRRAGNSLLMSKRIKSWFDSYHIVIVPVDATEDPIRRWRTDVISPSLRNTEYAPPNQSTSQFTGKGLDGKELVFLNENRPVARFLYFHFVMALVRIRNIERQGWKTAWARYYEQRPFPTPGKYLRQSMLLALATHFETADMNVVQSWIQDQGFDSPLKLTDDEAMEVARRIHMTAEEVTIRSEERKQLEEEGLEEEEDSEEE
ncbi:hypothetical protein EDB81DRAFT_796317 [Dactylonectria macrodidyma]|uniref:HNH nuclease domain-containing protein n=1 Tax=Dactylonectria macrodidyma TaxID=307937 RepID=A0A9P9J0Q4_9HYPO|nr:hypothetical protein EDB81DRAFT_796317 [Dactylonectria macrodidyma]